MSILDRKQRNAQTSSIQYSLHTKVTFKINIVGKKSVGKSSLILREIKNTFGNLPKNSKGFQFYSKTFKGKDQSISLQIWDTAGQSQYNSMTRNFFRQASVIVLVYDNIENLQEQIKTLKAQLDQYAHQSVKVCILRSKIDVSPVMQDQRQKLKRMCDEVYPKQIFYSGQVSSKTNQNVNKYFQQMTQNLFKLYEQDEGFREAVNPQTDSFLLNSVQKNCESPLRKQKKCC